MNIPSIFNDRRVQFALVGVGASAVSGTIGYILGKRKVLKHLERELTPLAEQFNEFLDEKERSLLTQLREDAFASEETVEVFEGEAAEEQREIVNKRNIFGGKSSTDDFWDYEAERSLRDGSKPYIIHKDEFFNDEMGYSQQTVTYYEGDNIVANEDESAMYGHETILGELLWGHGSNDINVVYIRNEKLEIEYEVIRDGGKYEIEVLGHTIEAEYEARELKHSRSPGKFRED